MQTVPGLLIGLSRPLVLALAFAAGSGCTINKYTSTSNPPASKPATNAEASGSVSSSASGAVDAETHEGSAGGAVECHGAKSVTVSDRVIDTPGNGVEAHGGCSITLIRCQIRAGAVAVEAHGGSHVVLRESNISGGTAAFELHGASTVEVANSSAQGRIEKHGGSTLRDLGGNSWQ
jgi:hypothetical protein